MALEATGEGVQELQEFRSCRMEKFSFLERFIEKQSEDGASHPEDILHPVFSVFCNS
jgi:hypothetical protein